MAKKGNPFGGKESKKEEAMEAKMMKGKKMPMPMPMMKKKAGRGK